MTGYKPGDVVLVPYPFGERAGGNKRPALVVSSAEYNEATNELLIAQITSRVSAAARAGDCLIEDWKQANLPRPALVRSRLATLKTCLVLRQLGELSSSDLKQIQKALGEAIFGF